MILLGELAALGWGYEHIHNLVDTNYYLIYPMEKRD
jgi:hypothetical protein